MQVLHSIWDTETFYIWAESSALPISIGKSDGRRKKHPSSHLHPFALPGVDLKKLFSQILPKEGDGCRVDEARFALGHKAAA